MNNTVSIRIEGNNTSKSINQLVHDMRIKKVSYLKSESQDNLLVTPYKSIIYSQNETNKELFEKIKEDMILSSQEQKEIHERTIGQKSQIKNYFINGIITFSTKMKSDFFENQEQFRKLVKQTFELVSKKYNIKLIYYAIHLDEKTPHVHFCFENVDRKTGRSVQRYISKSDLSQLQTDVADQWLEMGYKRGKKNSGSKHYSVAIGHQKEELENLKKQIQEQKKLIKQQEISESQKKEELDKLDIVLSKTRVKIKEVKDMSEIDEEISKDIDYIIKESKTLFKYESKLRENIKDKIKKYSKSRFKNQKEEIAVGQVEFYKEENEKLINDYNYLFDEYEYFKSREHDLLIKNDKLKLVMEKELLEKQRYIDKLDMEKKSLLERNSIYKDDIEELEVIHNFNYKEFRENKKNRQRRYKNY